MPQQHSLECRVGRPRVRTGGEGAGKARRKVVPKVSPQAADHVVRGVDGPVE